MRLTKSLLATMLAASCFAFTACSDDDNNNDNGVRGSVNPEQVFTAGLPTQVGNLTITKGADGRVTKIVEDEGTEDEYVYSFKYTSSRSDVTVPYDVVMSVNEHDGRMIWVFYIGLNEQGFAKYVRQIYDDGDTDEWWFGYNNNGQLNYMKRSEGDNEVTAITYSDGDIVKVDISSDDTEAESLTISYTNSTVTMPIANKGAIMLFDDLFEIDMDEFAPAYYAGLLGKATKHLPVENSESWTDDAGQSHTYTSIFKWTLNDNGFPVNLVESYDGYDESPIFFNWN